MPPHLPFQIHPARTAPASRPGPGVLHLLTVSSPLSSPPPGSIPWFSHPSPFPPPCQFPSVPRTEFILSYFIDYRLYVFFFHFLIAVNKYNINLPF